MSATLLDELAPHGVLRAGINMSNFLLVTSKDKAGQPSGVSPDMAHALAKKLGVSCQLLPYAGPGELADDAQHDAWDIGNIAAEPERAKTIQFSTAYWRSAYQLWLTDNLKNASLIMAPSIDASFEVFQTKQLEALAGLRPKLLEQQAQLPGSSIMQESFTAIQQSIGCRPDRPLAAAFIQAFVDESIASGFVQSLLEKHAVLGRLSVAPL